MKPDLVLRRRLIVINIMVPTLVIFVFLGGWPFSVFVAAVVALSTWEFWRLFRQGGFAPSLWIMLMATVSAVLLRQLAGEQLAATWLASLVLLAMVWHTIMYQRGVGTSAVDFAITSVGAVYLGWLASYAILIRSLEHGIYWMFLVFPIISLADSGAFLFGRAFGKHKMMALVSPKKSWEGYIGGILVGTLAGWGFATLWHIRAAGILPIHGVILGVALSILAPLGDFGESMLKRQFYVKDTSKLLLDHGGFLDRIDSSLWAAVIGYYLILLMT